LFQLAYLNNFYVYRFDFKYMKFNAHISKMASFGVHVNLRRRIVQYENTHTHTYYLKENVP